MERSMITSTNTLGQLQQQIDTISNNIANVDTTGYKSTQTSFQDMLEQQIDNQPDATKEVGRTTSDGIRVGVGAKLAGTKLSTQQGSITQTGRSLDVALTAPNQYLKVLNVSNNEVNYTRDGALYLSPTTNNQNLLVDAAGNPILDENSQQIRLSQQANTLDISKTGQLLATTTSGATQSFNLGVAKVNRVESLEKQGNNLYALTPNQQTTNAITNLTGNTRSTISIENNALEASNVDLSKELTDLMTVQRAYQFQSRAITISDQMMGLVNSIR